jgi:hypothetical protein
MSRRAKRYIKKRDADLAKQGTTAGQVQAARSAAMSKAQADFARLPAAGKWAAQNPDNAKYDQDGNPVDFTHWLGNDR